ncbi:periplasmic heavy metal sensor [Rhodobacter calidifons]|uniref:Periplasmic heavy metal sensor n=1 Tax=Rhodobacter calidifons TaxID=2715277 RepID=A0ABX0GCR0_9RHOB|nr:periplasmic heavy metal sensor [Rhodobacter calidifons]NHB78522.1 periplasmic heavy metal sensor [Rhodobacter calidifons]
MTDQHAPTQPPVPGPPAPAPAPSGARWLKLALAVSVGLNLVVAGLVLGAWLREGPRKGMPRDLSFGPFTEALSDKDRRALRRDLMGRLGEFRTAREAARAEFAGLLTALRAEPFDPEALKAALAAIETRNADRLELGRSLIETRLIEMSTAERQAFADRLERGLQRRPRP